MASTRIADQKVTLISSGANQRLKLNKTNVERIPFPASGQVFVRDAELNGFALRVTPGSKSFVVEKRIDRKVKRMTLGRYPELTPEQARREAHKLLGKIATGINPIAEKLRAQFEGMLLEEAFRDFLATRKSLKPHTVYDYRRLINVAFADWQARPITSITKDMVAKRHTRLGEQRGEAYANLAMRFLRSLFNFAMVQYEAPDGASILRENPIARLTQTRAWYQVGRRQSVIKPHQLAAWFDAVMALKSSSGSKAAATIADYLLLLLFTGLRRGEAARLSWEQVDLKQRTLVILDTKNREPLTLPLSDFLAELLAARKVGSDGEYVFPSEGRTGYLMEPRKQMHHVMVQSGVEFTLHDLRRTFITVAESLDISGYGLKRLVNHKMSNDVTAGYIISVVERLREPMQRITTYLLKAAGRLPSAEVVSIAQVKAG
ncbi:MAG: integrase arm-type DNA-binding domain-containing protein [Thiobacillaceae bacterium]